MRLSPHDPTFLAIHLGDSYRRTGRYGEAIAAYKKLICRSPDVLFAHVGLALSYGALGRDEEARNAVAELRRVQPDYSLALFETAEAVNMKLADLKRALDILRKAGLQE